MKVSKNITISLENAQLIKQIWENTSAKSFSGAIDEALDQLKRFRMIRNRLEDRIAELEQKQKKEGASDV